MSGWQLSGDAPTAYTRFALKVMEPWTDDLILAARCRDGDRVLDVACGTGLVASRVSLVSHKLCAITGVDINDGMLSAARRNQQIEWHQGSAVELPFLDGSFDVVLCQQGLQYFPDRTAAVREMARVLAPGGRIALNVWGALERQPFYVALVDGIVRFLGENARAGFDLAFSLNTAAELRTLAQEAGLKNVRIRFEHRTTRYPSPEAFVAGFMGATPVTEQFLALTHERQAAFVRYVVDRLAEYVDDDGLAFPQENHFLAAAK
ncbi:MAG TPA: methyltransferase domain-containing protein [Acetobacteraceae bacterium]|nr:methyltransferase domain-containing protein [Acetobacteraceae bacterium]